MDRINHLVHRLVETLGENKSLTTWVVVPFLLFVIDIILRGALQLDLSDAGADLALLAVAAFISSLIEDPNRRGSEVQFSIFLFFFALWLVCLIFTSSAVPIIRQYFPLGGGLASSCILTPIFLKVLEESSGS